MTSIVTVAPFCFFLRPISLSGTYKTMTKISIITSISAIITPPKNMATTAVVTATTVVTT
jgi:hypothetical protein